MQTICLETDPQTASAEETLNLDVFLMHDDMRAGLRGKQALDQVAERLGLKAEFNFHLWKFDLLNEPPLRDLAVTDAQNANIVVLAVHETSELPEPVRLWLNQWMKKRSDVPCAIVLSLDSQAQATPHPTLNYVQSVAEPAGVDLFPHYGDTPRVAWNWTAKNDSQTGSTFWATNVARLPEPHAAWGINE